MRFTTAAFLLLLGPLWASAGQSSTTVTGSVDGPDGLVAGAIVTLARDAMTREAQTDVQGRYVFADVGPGRYRVTASAPGLRATREIAVASAPQSVALTLVPAFTDVSIVTTSREVESLLGAAASVSVVVESEISSAAAESVPGLLQSVPGLNFTQFGARDVDVNARDASGRLANSMLVMVDGRPLNQPFYGAVFWDLMTVDKRELSQIEVVRTPASALWGANALNGAINIRTKSPREMLGLRGYLAGGERDSFSAGATWADAPGRISYKLSAAYLRQAPWDRDNTLPDGSPMPPLARFENRGTRQPKFDARVDWNDDRNRLWSFRGGLAGAYGLIHSALGPGEFAPGSYASYLEADHQGSTYEVKAYWNRLDWPFRIVLFGLDQTASNDTYAVEATRQLTVGERHRMIAGGTLRLDRFDISVAPNDRQRVDGAAFVEDRIRLTDQVSAVAGARLDKFDTTSAVVSPRVGIVVSPLPSHTFRATYNRAYRTPSLLENFSDVTLPAVLPLPVPFLYFQRAVGSTSLDMESHDAFEAGYVGTLNRHTLVTATVYDQTVDRKIWFVPIGFYSPVNPPPGWPGDPATVPVIPNTFTFVNAGNTRQRGVELGARFDWPSVTARGSYTFQATPTLKDNTTPYPLQINRPARNKASAGVTYARDAWTASSDVTYTDRAFWADVLTEPFWGYTDSLVNVDALARYQLPAKAWRVWVSATDLLNRRIKSHVYGDTITRRVMAGIDWQLRTR